MVTMVVCQSVVSSPLASSTLTSSPVTIRHSDVPPEIWTRIFRLTNSRRELKGLSFTCRHFQKIASSVLWLEPILVRKISYSDLCQFGSWQVPIKSLRLSQLRYDKSTTVDQFEQLVQLLLTRFQLASFQLDSGYPSVTDLVFRLLLHLPITAINTTVFCSRTPVGQLVALMTQARHCQSVVYSPGFHSLLSIDSWRKLSCLSVTTIYACFGRSVTKEYFEQYNSLLTDSICNLNYIIGDYHHLPLYPEHLLRLDKVRITQINVGKFSTLYSVRDYTDALVHNCQSPVVVIPAKSSNNIRLSAGDLICLFQFSVAELHTSLLRVNNTDSTAEEIVSLIVRQHARHPIRKFVLDRRRNFVHFTQEHMRRLKEAGLISS